MAAMWLVLFAGCAAAVAVAADAKKRILVFGDSNTFG